MAKRAKPPAKRGRAATLPKVPAGELVSLLDFVRYAVSRFLEAGLVFAHGTTDPVAEAAFLVCETLHLNPDQFEMFATARVTAREARAILEVIELTRGEAEKNGVSVHTQFADGLPLIQGDRVQLQQVMLNLIVNAIQSMSGVEDGNRELHISTLSIEPEGACVAVRDSGHGLRPESLPRLIEPFYTTKPDGMGMGLPICRSIIEAHNGRLWATRCETRGALFQFTIPAD